MGFSTPEEFDAVTIDSPFATNFLTHVDITLGVQVDARRFQRRYHQGQEMAIETAEEGLLDVRGQQGSHLQSSLPRLAQALTGVGHGRHCCNPA